MTTVRFGVAGLGNMGLQHAACLAEGSMAGATLGALCNRGEAGLAKAKERFAGVPGFLSLEEMLRARACDAVLIVTPHYEHPAMVRAAFEAGMHVLVEKPLAVSIGAAREIVREYAKFPRLKFGIMYNQRSNPMYRRIRELVRGRALGEISRITWIITNWFRPNAYYRSSAWRATWKGEGGGVLINQCPHNLDLLWWMTGMMPRRITAVAYRGKTHPIEVEDEVNAIFEYESGATGHFVTTTGEAPGTNRLEIAGSLGKVVAENNVLTIVRNEVDARAYRETSTESFSKPASTTSEEMFPPPAPHPAEHRVILQDFTEAILQDRANGELLAPGPEGVYALEMANGMLMAGLRRQAVELPLEGEGFEGFLRRLVEGRD